MIYDINSWEYKEFTGQHLYIVTINGAEHNKTMSQKAGLEHTGEISRGGYDFWMDPRDMDC